MIKRFMDIGISLFVLIFFSPLFIVIPCAIRISSPGPVFFRQVRVGRKGKQFNIFKFRTMAMRGKTADLLTGRNDSRVTGVGRILRKFKIDELPQFINVLKGDMSVVGPRPEIPELVAYYSKEQMRLLEVRPGITSPASLLFKNEEDMIPRNINVFEYHRTVLVPKKAEVDLEYIQSMTFLLDVKIIALTLISTLGKIRF